MYKILGAVISCTLIFLSSCSSVPVNENEHFLELVGNWEVIDNTFPNGDKWGDSHYEFSPEGSLTIHHWLNPMLKMGNKNVGTWQITRVGSRSYYGKVIDKGESDDPNWTIGKGMGMSYRMKDNGHLFLSWNDSMAKGNYLVLKKCDQTCRRENP